MNQPKPESAAAKVKPAHSTAADTSAAVDAFVSTLDQPRKAEIEALRAIFLGADARIAEGIKWKSPSFRSDEYFATVNLRSKVGIGVILHLGAKVRALPDGGVAIADPSGLLKWLAADRAQIEFADLAAIEAQREALTAVIRQWLAHV